MGAEESRPEENEPFGDMTTSLKKKRKNQGKVMVHDYEITLALNCHDLVDMMTSWEWLRTGLDPGKVTSQFLRDRCYTLHQDTYVAVDSVKSSDLDFGDLFSAATQQKFKKIIIKSTDPVSAIQKLCNSSQIKLNKEKARRIQINVLLRLPNFQFFTFAVDLVKAFGRINTLVIDCRAINHSKLLELLDQFRAIPGEIIHDLEFILNFNPGDQIAVFSQIVDSVKKIASTISFEITTYGDDTQIAAISKGLDNLASFFLKEQKLPLNSLALKFYGFFNQDADATLNGSLHRLIQNALKVFIAPENSFFSKTPRNEVLRALTLDFSQLYVRKVDNLINIMKTLADHKIVGNQRTFLLGNFYLNLQNQFLEETMLNNLLNSIAQIQKIVSHNVERMTFYNFCLKLESDSELIPQWFSELINTDYISKNMFTHVNVDFKCSDIFKYLKPIQKLIMEKYQNEDFFSTFILPHCRIGSVQNFEDSMKQFFQLAKTIGKNVFEVVYFSTYISLI